MNLCRAVIAVALLLVLLGDLSCARGRQSNTVSGMGGTGGNALSKADEILAGLRAFYPQTARADGSFQPGIDPDYPGMADCASSDLAAITYACTIHKTFGWRLPYEEKTRSFLLARQNQSGEFFNVAGTVDPGSPEGRTYDTTQGLVALHALGAGPRYNALPVFEEILRQDYKTLPAYSTSFFPLAYLCSGQSIPPRADRGIRALMIQDETGCTLALPVSGRNTR